jgi:plastocyanin
MPIASHAFNAFVEFQFTGKMVMRKSLMLACLAACLGFAASGVHAQDHTITIKDHKFTPSEIKVPANKRVQLTVINDDPTPDEFESHEMKVEKVIPGKTKAIIRIGPLKPGKYPFFGEFHEATAKGTVIVE